MNNVHRTRIGRAIAVSFRQLRAPLIISLGLVGFAAPTAVSAAPAGKTTICHATGSAKNPYVRITVSNEALAAHGAHQDGRDIIPAPETCPASVPPPPPVDACPNIPGDQSTVPEGFVVDGAGNCVPDPVLPFIECVVSDGVMQTATTGVITRTCGSTTRSRARRTFLVDQNEMSLAVERRRGRNADVESTD